MNILPYTEAHHRFRRRVRKFMDDEVMPHVDAWERQGLVPKSVWCKMGRAGFLCMDVAPEYGGDGGYICPPGKRPVRHIVCGKVFMGST